MVSLILLLTGLACALISRIMLFIAALNISAGWAIGVWLPFGPLCFRRTFPDQSKPSALFRTLTIPCFFLYLVVGETRSGFGFRRHSDYKPIQSSTSESTGYATERTADSGEKSVEERRAANIKELDRLTKRGEALRLRKRDLLRSDVEGNKAYEAEFALYNEALSKATLEKSALAPAAK